LFRTECGKSWSAWTTWRCSVIQSAAKPNDHFPTESLRGFQLGQLVLIDGAGTEKYMRVADAAPRAAKTAIRVVVDEKLRQYSGVRQMAGDGEFDVGYRSFDCRRILFRRV
jgi:hypothetical protein